jgi:cytidyltransferase-like protein
MLIDCDALGRLRGTVVMVDGAFDPLHDGHLEYFEAAARLGGPVLCNVTGDDYVATKHPPLLPHERRARLIDALHPIAYTHAGTRGTAAVLRALRPRIYAKGEDWRGRLPEDQVALCGELGIEIVYLDTIRDSSSRLLARYVAATSTGDRNGHREAQALPRGRCGAASAGDALERFERLVAAQSSTSRERYDEEYFTEGWRDDGNAYTLEARRRIEGRHPELLREVFGPVSVLDMGCGPGALMELLREQGVTADGVDWSPRCRELAPAAVRERIRVDSLLTVELPDRSYDLVICREVLEHLTVLEVQRAVQNLCRIANRYLYLTTRFHPDPESLLDVTDERHVDPTHITLLSQDLLRTLIVLQGFRRRADLEGRMDWLRKGRVLVYERANR